MCFKGLGTTESQAQTVASRVNVVGTCGVKKETAASTVARLTSGYLSSLDCVCEQNEVLGFRGASLYLT